MEQSGTAGASIRRWTAKRKRALVVQLLRGETTLAEASRAHDLPPGCRVLADRAYDCDRLRDAIAVQGAVTNVPGKRNRKRPPPFDPHLYRARNVVERFFNKLKHFRRIATRYEKHAENFLAMNQARRHPHTVAN